MYPCIEININKLKENAKNILSLLNKHEITSCFLVSKVLAGNKKLIESIYNLGFSHLADSRIENLKNFRDFKIPKVLLRLPMHNEISNVVNYSDISLNSEITTILKLNYEAIKKNKTHGIILMFDLGDLREGIFYKDNYIDTIDIILKLNGIKLIGIGTNLTCYGGIIPTKENLNEIVKIKNNIESNYNIKLEIISGGNSSSLYLLNSNQMVKEINNLRIGEALFLGKETAYSNYLPNMNYDIFTLKAQIIEVKNKPSYPIGEMGIDSFGIKPNIIDKGKMTRGILAIGKQDIHPSNLFPLDKNIEIIGGSSDHLIVDLTNTKYKIGDIISFNVNYPGLLQLMTSKYVKKEYI